MWAFAALRADLASRLAAQAVRRRVLVFFSVTRATHLVVWTAVATAALKLAAERLPWTPDDGAVVHQWYLHSAAGVAAYAVRGGGRVVTVEGGGMATACGKVIR
ncbi:hypothetical protein I4F81_007804 [Pyropia yezoensis]|uniref:Uncharacterized protein n=2 Tax=Pyropia yezoensis TaxID=2788 RepID=A0ACC3C5M2_PYRYE|nr:hypothetical protein I4F81_003646 [Neopyropia yezoensis]KAK1865271.1 hypothetical protein I4F81_007804 [Neopyropia yezoensis]